MMNAFFAFTIILLLEGLIGVVVMLVGAGVGFFVTALGVSITNTIRKENIPMSTETVILQLVMLAGSTVATILYIWARIAIQPAWWG